MTIAIKSIDESSKIRLDVTEQTNEQKSQKEMN